MRSPLLVALAASALLLLGAAPATAATPSGTTITGVDLHDGTMLQAGGRTYLYGTMYGCGFQWQKPSPWCGFGVASAPSPAGPWSAPRPLFDPAGISPYAHLTWQQDCGGTGAGCFNPRMVQRSGWGRNDGAWLLWFNAPADYGRNHANAYYVLTCDGPAGPCRNPVKPALHDCAGNGDFSIVRDDPRPPVMLCTMPDQTLAAERLDASGTAGVGGGRHHLAGLTRVESPGAYRDAASGAWILTYSDPNCGYCAGTATAYATAPALDGVWTAPAAGRRGISATSCGGQPRTVVTLGGQPHQLIDLWLGTRNETKAGLRLEPLRYHPPTPVGSSLRAFDAWTC